MVYLVENAHQAQTLVPLLCRPQQHMIHVLVAGSQGMSGSALQRTLMGIDTLSCLGRDWITVHDLDAHDANTFATHMMQIIDILRPHVVLHVSPPESSLDQLLATIAPKQPWTLIAMPQDQVRHALWLPDLPLQALRHWNRISIQLVIITDRRPHSLSRLLHSCSKSFFLGDKVDVTINMEQSADKVTHTLVQSYNWMHGKKTLRHRVQKGGLMPAIVESWYPRHDDDYGVLLEDDISLSPLFYTWLKYNILKYRYSPVDAHDSMLADRIFGISLYSPRNVELHLVGRRPFDPTAVLYNSTYPARIPYASQVPCSWGAVYFPQQWREFHAFLTAQLDDMAQNQVLNISLPMSRSDRWKKSWKKYLIQMVYLRGYVMVYPNYQDFESFATNHLETGTHVKSEKRQRIIDSFLVPLMARNTLLHQLPDQRLPDIAKMPILDLWGKLVSHDILQSRADRWHTRVSACERSVTRALDDPSDLLCPFSLVPAWDRPGYSPPYKKIKIPTLTEVVEPLAYQTAVARVPDAREDTQDDDFPWRIDVAVLNPVTDEIAVHDDELADLVANLRA
ncbi:hypothetical protein BC940DRAFT_326768 [Gongronella butleri]|nr:hypothetical protein BC940DRAFT_326768 [Gongronella butleri]